MASALVKFTQGIYTDVAGRALKGRPGTPVVCSNGDNTNIIFWEYSILDVPEGSSVPVGVFQSGTNPTGSFTPDKIDAYRIRLKTRDTNNNEAIDIRQFLALDDRLLTLPAFNNTSAAELNFNGQTEGWLPLHKRFFDEIRAHLPYFVLRVDMNGADKGVRAVKSGRGDLLATQFTYTTTDFGCARISWGSSLGLPTTFNVEVIAQRAEENLSSTSIVGNGRQDGDTSLLINLYDAAQGDGYEMLNVVVKVVPRP